VCKQAHHSSHLTSRVFSFPLVLTILHMFLGLSERILRTKCHDLPAPTCYDKASNPLHRAFYLPFACFILWLTQFSWRLNLGLYLEAIIRCSIRSSLRVMPLPSTRRSRGTSFVLTLIRNRPSYRSPMVLNLLSRTQERVNIIQGLVR
jgi:hypothetical protein